MKLCQILYFGFLVVLILLDVDVFYKNNVANVIMFDTLIKCASMNLI